MQQSDYDLQSLNSNFPTISLESLWLIYFGIWMWVLYVNFIIIIIIYTHTYRLWFSTGYNKIPSMFNIVKQINFAAFWDELSNWIKVCSINMIQLNDSLIVIITLFKNMQNINSWNKSYIKHKWNRKLFIVVKWWIL